MDSMRSLNTSLPSSTPRPQPPEQLLQSFKTAALSVTNLYKNAVYVEAQARQAGYQEAIEDLLHFLDRENLGLSDGQGWRVRQWATERSDGTGPTSDDDEAEKRTRSATPAVVRKESESEAPRQTTKSVSPTREEQTAAQQPPLSTPAATPQPTETNVFDRPTIFTFSAGPAFPQPQEQDLDMQNSETSTPSSQDDAPVSVSVLSRNPRQQSRHNNLSRSNPRTATRESPVALGSKRKIQFPDFFDLSGIGNNRDMFGGGKRGRFA
ncbi:hypothetical protein P175DRAFT_0504130 [Aspergillus ochraceoroseus IBT 24754]|uniref:Uncharacterized protein n=3 Tax=Aspergillus subgen. Nidulantes TaxID=2720870 RepID=A0A0F8V6I9_9EURO|nr:uncharacterized protein P175DRAFT_0504130 [Aspergillus ochraceoroseus IBT 24754]KKK14151.1 hypothetical protein AOCH_002744 [Aspergillus ochraceoroseus]KKK18591.1 hypothetical protein ARAM_005266 [Aspergillus rambellii]PTU18220.1 hypothetical protein P175DRAFT_0504130 [Aspergillus ochraceoroseus IBT 24754]